MPATVSGWASRDPRPLQELRRHAGHQWLQPRRRGTDAVLPGRPEWRRQDHDDGSRSPAGRSRPRARCSSTARTSRDWTSTRSPGAASAASSRCRPCSATCRCDRISRSPSAATTNPLANMFRLPRHRLQGEARRGGDHGRPDGRASTCRPGCCRTARRSGSRSAWCSCRTPVSC